MTGKQRPFGPSNRRFAENLRLWRRRRGLTTPQLEKRLSGLGQPILESGISRIESKIRRVDLDDLTALSIVLDVSPGTLLMPPCDGPLAPGELVDLTPSRQASLGDAWAWTCGETSLDGAREAEFITRNRPHRLAPPAFTGDASRTALDAWLAVGEAVRAALQSGVDSGTLRSAFETALVAGLTARRSA
jgi:transcriptional regulator with XRE-family HTH domain